MVHVKGAHESDPGQQKCQLSAPLRVPAVTGLGGADCQVTIALTTPATAKDNATKKIFSYFICFVPNEL